MLRELLAPQSAMARDPSFPQRPGSRVHNSLPRALYLTVIEARVASNQGPEQVEERSLRWCGRLTPQRREQSFGGVGAAVLLASSDRPLKVALPRIVQ